MKSSFSGTRFRVGFLSLLPLDPFFFLSVFRIFLLFFFFSPIWTLCPEEKARNIPTAREFLEMPMDKAFPIIARLKKEEARELITQIRALARPANPDVDKLYFLLSHLEEIQAIEKEQARLESLLWVFGLGFLVFTGFLAFLIVQQRKLLQDFQRVTK